MNNTVFSRPKECRIHSGDNELFPLHSFDNGLCLDDRLGVELLEISHSVRFKYRTFRFQNLKTINQRSRITWFLRRIDFWQNRGGPSRGVPAFRSVDPWSEDRMFYSSTYRIIEIRSETSNWMQAETRYSTDNNERNGSKLFLLQWRVMWWWSVVLLVKM